MRSEESPPPGKREVGGVDLSAGNAGVRPAGSRAAPPAFLRQLIASWQERANDYDRSDREAQKKKEYIIAAQQAGLSTAFRVCASELHVRVEMEEGRSPR